MLILVLAVIEFYKVCTEKHTRDLAIAALVSAQQSLATADSDRRVRPKEHESETETHSPFRPPQASAQSTNQSPPPASAAAQEPTALPVDDSALRWQAHTNLPAPLTAEQVLDAGNMMRQAHELLDAQRFDESAALYRKTVARYPQDAQLRSAAIAAFLTMRRPDAARELALQGMDYAENYGDFLMFWRQSKLAQ